MTEKDEKIEKNFEIVNRLGLHARAASLFVDLANSFACDVLVKKDEQEINGKSIMGILILAAGCGTSITVTAIGTDAAGAVQALGDLIDRGFDE